MTSKVFTLHSFITSVESDNATPESWQGRRSFSVTIQLSSKNEYDSSAKLEVKPSPRSVLRVFAAFKTHRETVASLNLPSERSVEHLENKMGIACGFKRKGLTVIEWGAVIID